MEYSKSHTNSYASVFNMYTKPSANAYLKRDENFEKVRLTSKWPNAGKFLGKLQQLLSFNHKVMTDEPSKRLNDLDYYLLSFIFTSMGDLEIGVKEKIGADNFNRVADKIEKVSDYKYTINDSLSYVRRLANQEKSFFRSRPNEDGHVRPSYLEKYIRAVVHQMDPSKGSINAPWASWNKSKNEKVDSKPDFLDKLEEYYFQTFKVMGSMDGLAWFMYTIVSLVFNHTDMTIHNKGNLVVRGFAFFMEPKFLKDESSFNARLNSAAFIIYDLVVKLRNIAEEFPDWANTKPKYSQSVLTKEKVHKNPIMTSPKSTRSSLSSTASNPASMNFLEAVTSKLANSEFDSGSTSSSEEEKAIEESSNAENFMTEEKEKSSDVQDPEQNHPELNGSETNSNPSVGEGDTIVDDKATSHDTTNPCLESETVTDNNNCDEGIITKDVDGSSTPVMPEVKDDPADKTKVPNTDSEHDEENDENHSQSSYISSEEEGVKDEDNYATDNSGQSGDEGKEGPFSDEDEIKEKIVKSEDSKSKTISKRQSWADSDEDSD